MCADIGVLISQSSFAVGEGHSIDLASRIGNNGVSSPSNTLIAGLAQSMARKECNVTFELNRGLKLGLIDVETMMGCGSR